MSFAPCRVLVWLVYNSFEGQDNLRAWEQRLKRASYFLRCHEALSTPMDDKYVALPAIGQYHKHHAELWLGIEGAARLCREAALPSIAQWISGLFASVDLSPTDLTEAIILTAAAQSMRRKMRIKRALAPAVGSLSSASMSDASSDTTSMASLDGPLPFLIPFFSQINRSVLADGFRFLPGLNPKPPAEFCQRQRCCYRYGLLYA